MPGSLVTPLRCLKLGGWSWPSSRNAKASTPTASIWGYVIQHRVCVLAECRLQHVVPVDDGEVPATCHRRRGVDCIAKTLVRVAD